MIEETNYQEEKSCRCEYSQPVNAASVRIFCDIPVLYRVSQSPCPLPPCLHILVAEKNDNCFKVAAVNTLPRPRENFGTRINGKWQLPSDTIDDDIYRASDGKQVNYEKNLVLTNL